MSPIFESVVPLVFDFFALLIQKRHWRIFPAAAIALALCIVWEVAELPRLEPVVEIAVFVFMTVVAYGVLTLVARSQSRDSEET